MTNWGDIASQQMASKQENRVREARFMANADSYMTDKPKRSMVAIVRTIRQKFAIARAENVAVANRPNTNLKRETQQHPVI